MQDNKFAIPGLEDVLKVLLKSQERFWNSLDEIAAESIALLIDIYSPRSQGSYYNISTTGKLHHERVNQASGVTSASMCTSFSMDVWVL